MRDISLKDATYDLAKACEDAERALDKIEAPPWDNPAAKQEEDEDDIFVGKYRPDQERDERGRWTEEGGGGRGNRSSRSRTRGKKPATTTGKPKKQPKKPAPKAPAKKPPKAKKPAKKPPPPKPKPKAPSKKPAAPKKPRATRKPKPAERPQSTALVPVPRTDQPIDVESTTVQERPAGLVERDRRELEQVYSDYDASAARLRDLDTQVEDLKIKLDEAWDRVASTSSDFSRRMAERAYEQVDISYNRVRAQRDRIATERARLRSSISDLESRLRGEKRLVKRTAPGYVCRRLLNAERFIAWAKSAGFDTTIVPSDMHVTLAYSREAFTWPEARHTKLVIKPADNRTLERFGKAVVLRFNSAILDDRWNQFLDMGAKWEHDEYKPHVTISYKLPEDVDISEIEPYSGELVFGPEEVKEFNDDVDHVEKLREVLGGVESRSFAKRVKPQPYYRCTFIKADESLGLIFGWAIVSSIDGEPYYDTQGDHIPEDSMLKAAAEFMLSRRTMKIMHEGRKVGSVVFAWPMTEEIASAMGVGDSRRTGLMVAVKPDNPNVIRRFQDRQYTGFSIGGNRLIDEEVD